MLAKDGAISSAVGIAIGYYARLAFPKISGREHQRLRRCTHPACLGSRAEPLARRVVTTRDGVAQLKRDALRLTSNGHGRDVSSVVCTGSPAESELTSAASAFPGLLHPAPKACVTSSGEGGSGRSHRWAKASARSGQISR